MSDKKADLIVVGGGPGGYVAALKAAKLGAKVILIEKANLGGTCLNWGCIPTKVFSKTVELLHKFIQAENIGIKTDGLAVNFDVVQKHKNETIEALKAGVTNLLLSRGVEIVEGQAFLEEPDRVMVKAHDGNNISLKASKLILATGSSSMELPDLPFDDERVLSSKEILQLKKIPKSLIVIGGGVLGLEFASIFAGFGTRVVLVEMLEDILPFMDRDVVTTLKEEMASRNVEIYTSSKISRIEKFSNGVKAEIETSAGSLQIKAEKVLVAIGRKPNLDIGKSIGLVKDGKLVVDDKLETSVKGIYAVGDLIGGYQLAHVAYYEGNIAAENALGANKKVDYRAVPQGIFTYPEVAGVGLTEQEAKEKYSDLQIGISHFTASSKAMVGGDTVGFIKIIAAAKYNEILGVFIIGSSATEMIHEAVLAINLEATLEEVAATIHAHPTLSETFSEAVIMGLG